MTIRANLLDPPLELPAVDPGSGDVNHNGDVIIRGDVADGFKVVAAGSVTVHGVIGGSTIDAARDLVCEGGIFGQGKARCLVGGNLRTRHIANATVEVRGDVAIGGELWQSTLHCGGSLQMPDAPIAASTVTVAGSVTCDALGVAGGAPTTLAVGINEFDRRSISALLADLAKQRKALEQIDVALNTSNQRGKMLTPKEKERMTELMFERDDAMKQMGKAIATLKTLWLAFIEPAPPTVQVRQAIHSGVTVQFANWAATTAVQLNGPATLLLRKVSTKEHQVYLVNPEREMNSPLATRRVAEPWITMLASLFKVPEEAAA